MQSEEGHVGQEGAGDGPSRSHTLKSVCSSAPSCWHRGASVSVSGAERGTGVRAACQCPARGKA